MFRFQEVKQNVIYKKDQLYINISQKKRDQDWVQEFRERGREIFGVGVQGEREIQVQSLRERERYLGLGY